MTLQRGDYAILASHYAAHRPGYAPGAAAELVRLAAEAAGRRPEELAAVDVGAGTGIWTRQLAALGPRVVAVEPDGSMLSHGRASAGVRFVRGRAEAVGLAGGRWDLVTMASSFHWTDFERATGEFARLLRPHGAFAALWNTRDLAGDPLLVEIESELERRFPRLERVSSGGSAFCDRLAERLAACEEFRDVRYVEDRHVEEMTPERYVGIWRSVNDVRRQAGEAGFAAFVDWVRARLAGVATIRATYRTRMWIAWRSPDRARTAGGALVRSSS